MELELSFDNGLIRGCGTDSVAAFEILGHYQIESQTYQFTKQYHRKHSVIYDGRPSARGLSGRWHIPNNWGGNFEIWPTGSEIRPIDLAALPCP